MQEKSKSLTRKIILGLLTANLVIGGFFVSFPAKAQFGGVISNPAVDPLAIPYFSQGIAKNARDIVAPSLTTAAMMALVNAGNYFMQKLAYDTATYIGSGGKGQKPLLFTTSWGTYLENTMKGAAGEFLGSLSQTWGKGVGFNLCQPPGALKISFMLGLTQTVKPPTPKCDWAQIEGNWGKFLSTATNGDALKAVSASFSPGNSSLGLAVKTNSTLDAYVTSKVNEASKSREGNSGYKDVTSIISGKVQTPASVMEQKSRELSGQPMAAQQQGSLAFGQALSAGAWSILPSALSTFTNVLLSNFTKRLFEGLFKTEDTSQADPYNADAAVETDTETVKAQFAYLLTPTIQDSGAYDAVTEFSVCPDQFKSINNCVLDTSLSTAINQAKTGAPLTVSDAIAQGFLNKDLPLIAPNDPQNGDPYCFRKGYCYSNLVKLRRYRIIPVGWEFAAAKSDPKKPVTLGWVVSNFNNCNPVTGEADADPTSAYAWCHLIDPNWVLKYPSTECRAQVPGQTLTSFDAPTRSNVCVDAPSCISEDDNGKCVGGWGYCTKEKNIWRIGGDQCPAYYNSCATLTRTVDNVTQNLLKNTVDYSICSADNVGCRWYSRSKNLSSNTWQNINVVYLNRKAEKCDAADAGCSAFIKKDQGIRENLITNPSFEDGGALPDYWAPDANVAEYDTATVNSFHGSRAVRVTNGATKFLESKLPINLLPDTVYNLSAYAKKASGAPDGEEAQVVLTFAGIQVTDWAVLGNCTRAGNDLILKFNPADTYGRADCSFVTPESLDPDANTAQISLGVSATPGGDVWYDALQLSEGPFTQEFIEKGYGDEVPRVYLKAPPAWLGCTGSDNDNPACKSYARVCTKPEAGCELWTPKNGDPAVPAVTTANDSCPRECIGYETWRQEPTAFTGSQFPLYFIPTTGAVCSANEAGCDEFTNIETAAAGGETKEYFVDFRRCMKPNPSEEATYYTWEGSDATGYQLKSFVLQKGAAQAGENGAPPAYQAGTDYSLCTKDIFNARTNPDCREFYDADGNITYRLYSKTILSTPDCAAYRKTDSTETDCTVSGGDWNTGSSTCVYLGYKPESTTCKAAAKGCRAYVGNTGRNVREVFSDNMEKQPADGVWDGLEAPVPSTESTVAGGHSYKISGTNASFVNALAPGSTYTLTFWAKGSGTIAPDIGTARDQNTPTSAAAQLTVNWKLYSFGPIRIASDHVLSATDKVNLIISGATSPIYIDNLSLKQVDQNIYVIKDSWQTPVSCDQTSEGTYLPQAMLGCKDYTNRAGDSVALKSFSKICREASVGCSALVDTKNSTETQVKTWGAVCYSTADSDCSYNGNVVCHVAPGNNYCNFDILGNVPLANQNIASSTVVIPADATVYLVNDGNNSCTADKVGCEAVGNPAINTTEIKSIVAQFTVSDCIRMYGANNGVLSADQKTCTLTPSISFDVNNCSSSGWTLVGTAPNQTCQRLIYGIGFSSGDCTAISGTVSPDNKTCSYNTGGKLGNFVTSAYNDDYVMNSPDNYKDTLCVADAVSCEEYKDTNSLIYFKDPNQRVCEYRESVNYQGDIVNGWFKQGTDEPCDPAKKVGLAFYDIWHNGDQQYQNWAGQCSANADQCTEFVDPVDTQNSSGQPTAYYYIDNDKIDRSSCNGKVSPKEGCVLFDQTNIIAKSYSTGVSYGLSEKADNALETPVDSATTKVCMRQPVTCISWLNNCNPTAVDPLKTCSANSDCQPPPSRCIGSFCSLPRYNYTCNSVANDSNTIIKVRRDRECAEWLDCRSTTKVYDSLNNAHKSVCTSLDTCNAYIKQGEAVRCNSFIESDVRDDSGNPAVLTEQIYSDRAVSWGGREYSGYSIPNKYSVADLKTVSFGKTTDGNEDLRLTFVDTVASHSIVCPITSDGAACGTINNLGVRGVCMNGNCVYGTDGLMRNGLIVYERLAYDKAPAATCRAYPEKDAPFPAAVASWTAATGNASIPGGLVPVGGATSTYLSTATKNSTIAGGNVCEDWLDKNGDGVIQPNELQNCECSYRKAEYQNNSIVKYFDINGPPVPSGFCSGGDRNGEPCDPRDNTSCGDPAANGGTCQPLMRLDRLQGWDGQCLEKDLSTPVNANQDFACLTWRPVGVIPGGKDIYNQYSSAGYNQPTATTGKYYCLLAKGNLLQHSSGVNTYTVTEDYPQGDELVKDSNQGYDERILLSPSFSPENSGQLQEDQIFAIELVPMDDISEDKVPLLGTATPSGEVQQKQNAKDWLSQKGNIMSRAHRGIIPDGKYKGDTYWEVRWNIGWDAPAGKATTASTKPLFAYDPDTSGGDVKTSCNDGGNPYFGIRALFDANGNFLRFWTVMCDSGDSGRTVGITFKVNFLFGEPCQNIAQVVSDNGDSTALTDNLWRSDYSNYSSTDWFWKWVQMSGPWQPGAVSLKCTDQNQLIAAYNEVNKPPSPQAYFVQNCVPDAMGISTVTFKLGNKQFIQKSDHNPNFGSADSSVAPEGSKSPWFESAFGYGSPNVSTKYAPFIDAGTHWGCASLGNCAPTTLYSDVSDFETNGNIVNAPYSTSADNVPRNILVDHNLFWELFAKSYGIYSLATNNNNEYYDASAGSYPSFDLRGLVSPSGNQLSQYYSNYTNHPPHIAAPTSTCIDPSAGCEIAAIDAFSVNDRVRSNLVGAGDYFARLKFYGWADNNHMPLVSRTVDWNGDSSDLDRTVGSKYKNHKPYCTNTTCNTTVGSDDKGLTCSLQKNNSSGNANNTCIAGGFNANVGCQADAAHFGNSADACVQDYFEFTHTYVCSAKYLAGLPACNGSGAMSTTNYPCKKIISLTGISGTPIAVCVFNPRVQIIDNWHQCNGNCGSDHPCFGLGTKEDGGHDECALSSANGWTNFGGEIQVAPQ